MRLVSALTTLADLPEKEWQAQVVQLARTLGWRHFHAYRSTKSPAGFPDLTLVRERIIFVELKTERGKLTDAQKDWIEALLHAGAEAYVWRPADLDRAGRILAQRGDPFQARGEIVSIAASLRKRVLDEAAA
ncbi:MAG: VRR-NUC domain-containing protein [Gemmatimonadaceae bacterium]|nr:VRR-NUC domain-containing protein [Gemmatimonadaceae bacterium]